MAVYPSGYSAARAVAQVQTRTNEFVTPPAQNPNNPDNSVIGLLNAALEEVGSRLATIKTWFPIPIGAGVASVSFGLGDLQEVTSISYSTSSAPDAAGVVVYQMQQKDAAAFFDETGDQPNSGNGIPTWYYIKSDQSQNLTMQVWPPPSQNGFYFVFYRQRPQLWGTGTDTASLASTTQMDSMWQELAILAACKHVCIANEKMDMGDWFEKQYEKLLMEYKDRILRRARPKGNIVRDVRVGFYDPRPIWWG